MAADETNIGLGNFEMTSFKKCMLKQVLKNQYDQSSNRLQYFLKLSIFAAMLRVRIDLSGAADHSDQS